MRPSRWIASKRSSGGTRASPATPSRARTRCSSWRGGFPSPRTGEPRIGSASSSRRPRCGTGGASCSRRSPIGSRTGRPCSCSSDDPRPPGLGDAVDQGLASVVEADAERRRPLSRGAPRVRAARDQGPRRGARPLAATLPLRARRADRHRARDDDGARRRQAARRHPREEPLRHRRRRRQHLHRRARGGRRRGDGAALQAHAERQRHLRLARVHDAAERPLDRRAASRCTRPRCNIPDVYDLPPGSTFQLRLRASTGGPGT